MLGYVENMSGYYCRDCDAIKPLFVSPTPVDDARTLRSPASGPSRSIPSWRGTAIGGSLSRNVRDTRGRALERVAQQLMDGLESHHPVRRR